MPPLRILMCLAVLLTLGSGYASAQSAMHRIPEVPLASLASVKWVELAQDERGDVLQARLPDAKELWYGVDLATGIVWFKVVLYGSVPERWFGISVAIDSDGDRENGMTWWGQNKVKFDRLASAFVFQTDDGWQGYGGVGDAASITGGDMTNLTRDVKLAFDRSHQTAFLGVPRSSLGDRESIRVVATVGSMIANNDDIPNEGMVVVTLPPRRR